MLKALSFSLSLFLSFISKYNSGNYTNRNNYYFWNKLFFRIYIHLPMIRTLNEKKIIYERSNIICVYGNISNFLKVYFNLFQIFLNSASNKMGAQSRHTFQLRDPSAHNQSIRAKLSFPRIFKQRSTWN